MELKKDKNTHWFGHYSKKEIRKFPFVYLIVALPVLQIAVFFFYVNFSAIAMAFQDAEGAWSLESIKRVFYAFRDKQDSLNLNPWEMLQKSVISWGLVNIVCNLICIMTTYILTKHMIFSKAFRLIYHLPGLVGSVIMCIVMKEMYAPDGIVTNLVQSMGVNLPVLAQHNGLLGASETAFRTLMIQQFMFTIGGGGMIMAGAFMKIPEEIFESARLEGCGFFRETFQIALPCVWPTFSTLLIFSLCGILTADYGAYLYSDGTGKNGMVSVGYYLYRYQVSISQVPDATYMYGYVSAFGLLITLVTLPIVLISRKLLAKFQDNVEF